MPLNPPNFGWQLPQVKRGAPGVPGAQRDSCTEAVLPRDVGTRMGLGPDPASITSQNLGG